METRKLYTALTRDPQMLGVSYQMIVVIVFGSVVGFLATGSFIALLIGLPIFLFGRYLNNKDHQLMAVIYKKYTKTPPVKNHQFWNGANSYDVNLNNNDKD